MIVGDNPDAVPVFAAAAMMGIEISKLLRLIQSGTVPTVPVVEQWIEIDFINDYLAQGGAEQVLKGDDEE